LSQISPGKKIDLLLADIHGGILVPFIYDLPLIIPPWNQTLDDYVELIFFFVDRFFSKMELVIIFYPDDLRVLKEIISFIDNYHISINMK